MNNLSLPDTAMKDPFETIFRGFLAPMRFNGNGDELDIRLDVVERDDAFKVQADLPGVKKEDLNLRGERYYGTVSRQP